MTEKGIDTEGIDNKKNLSFDDIILQLKERKANGTLTDKFEKEFLGKMDLEKWSQETEDILLALGYKIIGTYKRGELPKFHKGVKFIVLWIRESASTDVYLKGDKKGIVNPIYHLYKLFIKE